MKIAILIDKELPLGLIANTAAILGLSLGFKNSSIIGPDLYDIEGKIHPGITTLPIPVLGCTGEQINNIFDSISSSEYKELAIIDFNSVAQKSKAYDDYSSALSKCSSQDIDYLGICIYGPVKTINKITGSISLLK